ncbi:MAG: hypothetical protein KF830_11175 [Planctomycetes bacterium]|nr:hypothetical protein [Planctomycetota bacterium]
MPAWWRSCAALLRAPANELAFALRAGFAWSRGAAVLPHEPKPGPGREPVAGSDGATERMRRYDLAALWARSTQAVFAKNLALLANLERLTAGVDLGLGPDAVRALDAGSGDFHYATALQRFLSRHGAQRPRAVELLGCEIDGHGIYRDGHSRADHARAHAALADEPPGAVRYAVADAARLTLPPQDVVTLFFPFLTVYPLLQWGLPLSRWRPRRLLRRLVAALRPGGWLLVANQTAAEYERLGALLADLPMVRERAVPFASELVPEPERTVGQIGSLWRRLDLRPPPVSG